MARADQKTKITARVPDAVDDRLRAYREAHGHGSKSDAIAAALDHGLTVCGYPVGDDRDHELADVYRNGHHPDDVAPDGDAEADAPPAPVAIGRQAVSGLLWVAAGLLLLSLAASAAGSLLTPTRLALTGGSICIAAMIGQAALSARRMRMGGEQS